MQVIIYMILNYKCNAKYISLLVCLLSFQMMAHSLIKQSMSSGTGCL